MSFGQIWCFYHKRHNSCKILHKPAGRLRYLNSAFPILGDYVASILCSFFLRYVHSGFWNRPLPSSKNPHFQNEARCRKPFLSKWVLFAWEWKMISISKAEHLLSFWSRGPGELGNGPIPCSLFHLRYLNSAFSILELCCLDSGLCSITKNRIGV